MIRVEHRCALVALALLTLAALLCVRPDTRRDALVGLDASALRFPCLSYAPFRHRTLSPVTESLRIPAEALERDLRQIASLTGCIRLYGTGNGLDQAPAIAARLGLRVWLGAWLGSDGTRNRQEMELALALAQQNRLHVDRLIVGSEVLLRGELPVAELGTLLDEARRRSPVPVAYADVWETWLRERHALIARVDQAVIHVLPYWEDHPVGADHALEHVVQTVARMRASLAPLPVVLGETGWPAAGRRRGPAQPGVTEQTRFLRELLLKQAILPLPVNVIEAFDQPWKASLEGMAGSAWGVLTADGEPRYRQAGEAVERLPGPLRALSATIGALLLLGVHGWRAGVSIRPGTSPWAHAWATLAALSGGASLGVLSAGSASDLALLAPYTAGWWWRALGLAVAMSWAALEVLSLCACLARVFPAGDAALGPAGCEGRGMGRLRGAALAAVTAYALVLVVDGRYVDLAWPLLAAGVVPRGLQRLLSCQASPASPWAGAGAAALVLLAMAVLWREGLGNTEALAVGGLMMILAMSSLRRDRTGSQGP